MSLESSEFFLAFFLPVFFNPKKMGRQAVSLEITKAKSLQLGGQRPRARKILEIRLIKRKSR